MIVVIWLVILWTPYLVMRLLHAQHARIPTTARPYGARTEPPTGVTTDATSQDEAAWSALDDRQLTRLLTDSAPRSITE